MTSFGAVFKTMLKQKNKQALAYFAVGAVISLVATIFFIFKFGLKDADNAAIGIAISTVVLLIVYVCYELAVILLAHRVSKSQTWQLVPAKKIDLLAANVLSATISVFFMTILCVVLFLILLIPFILHAEVDGNLFQGVGDLLKNGDFWQGLIWFILSAFVSVATNVTFWLLILDVTSALGDFLPLKGFSAKLVKVIIMAALFTLGVTMMARFTTVISNLFTNTFSFSLSGHGFSYHAGASNFGSLWAFFAVELLYLAVFFGGEYLTLKYLTEGKDKF